MNAAFLLLLGATIAWQPESEEVQRAIAIVKKAQGSLEFDEKAPGRPATSLNL